MTVKTRAITTETVVAYSQCPRKAYLLLCTSEKGSPHEYTRILEQQRQAVQRGCLNRLRQENADVQPYSLDTLTGKHDVLINATLEASGLVAKCAILNKVRTHSALGRYSYEPTIFVGTHSIKKEQKLALFFVGHVLEQVQAKHPASGRIIGLDGKSHRVKLENGPKTLIPFLEPVQEWAADASAEPPPLILNKHCPTCQFFSLCRAKAEQEDHLSLLDGISTLKALNRYERKGLFTVKQLSYTFKPRKRKKRAKNPPPVVHKPELQALAIREGKIYLQELPELTRHPVELFLDIEGVPDRQFYYLIGLLVSGGDTTSYYPFWADTPADEAQMWQQFLAQASQYPDAPIYHYGSFEPRALAKLAKRYDTGADGLANRLVNVNKHVYGKVYFPVCSNRLKEIGAFIGATWTSPAASGLQSLVWRHHWEETRSAEYKDLLLTYNKEDCQAIKLLADELAKFRGSADILSEVDFPDKRKRPSTEVSQQLQSQFGAILRSAHFGYDEKKISFRQGQQTEKQRKRGGQRGKRKPRSLTIKPMRIVEVPHGEVCPKCGHKPLKASKERSRRLIIDLVLTRNGIKKTVVEYTGNKGFCSGCSRSFSPPDIRKYERQQLYGHGLKAWLIYQRVALRLPYESVLESLEEHFNEKISAGRFVHFVEKFADYYADTEKLISQHLLESPFIHADETKFNIQGVNWYVWVFTNDKYVIFKLSETREATLVHEYLANYNGVLISDFYPGYDSVKCRQQKCWVHLIHDLNDDLRENPFDVEYETFVLEVRNLFVPIMETVQEYGLKKWHLNKFKRSVAKFYKKVITDKHYKSDLTLKYQKRFIRYRESLFTFLEEDGISWHNNTAERAIRHVAKQRAISSTFHESSTRNYLRLLSVRQTCRFQGKSFFKFLFSGETDLDKFEASKRKRRAK
jgi:predicted RecB family nuclease